MGSSSPDSKVTSSTRSRSFSKTTLWFFGAATTASNAGSQSRLSAIYPPGWLTSENSYSIRECRWIKEYVIKEKVKPVTVKERISVGATLPADVDMQAVPSAWGPSVSKYRYVYSNNSVYFVDPANRRVV